MKGHVFIAFLFLFNSCALEKGVSNKTSKNRINEKITKNSQQCYSKKEIDSAESTHIQNILKKISLINEVYEFSKLNNDTISYCIVDDNYQKKEIYKIEVGLDSYTHFSTRYVFYANKFKDEIKILEVINDSIMNIEDWRTAPWRKVE